MLPEYQKRLDDARKQKAAIRKYLDRVKQRRFPHLDQTVQAYHDQAFEITDCLQCANCCKTTGPLLKERDVERLATTLRIRPADFHQQYLWIDEDGDHVFRQMPCPFLLADNCCSVYDDRPAACRNYPHTSQRDFHNKLNITYHNAMICPAVAWILGKMMQEHPL